MARISNSLLQKRKKPTQARAKATVDVILRAAAHILRTEGWEAASTNAIAEKAGVSIGSLYQYFPSRDAILNALMEAHVAEMNEELSQVAMNVVDAPLKDAVRIFIRAMLQAHARDPKLHRVLTEQVHRMGGMARVRELLAPGHAMIKGYLQLRARDTRNVDPEVATFVLVNAVEAITHSFFISLQDFEQARLEDELCTLVVSYLQRSSGRKRRKK